MALARGLLCFAVLFLAVSAAIAAETSDSGDDREGRSNFWSRFADGFKAIEQQAHSHFETAMGGLVRRMSGAFPPGPAFQKSPAGSELDDDDDDDDDDNDDDDTPGTATAVVGVNREDVDSALGDLAHFASSFNSGFDSGSINLFGGFGGLFGQEPWWKGPNVCVERNEELDTPVDGGKNKPSSPETTAKTDAEEMTTTTTTERDREALEDEDEEEVVKPARLSTSSFASYRLSSCHETASKHECKTTIRDNGVTKTVIIRHRCCPGSRRVHGQPGCVKVEMKTVLETATAQGATLFTKLVDSSGLSRSFGHDANVTLFAPTDSAVRDYTESVMEQNDVARIRRAAPESGEDNEIKPVPQARSVSSKTLESAELVMAHMVSGQHEVGDLHRDQVLHTADDNSTIRINKYFDVAGPTVVTANCVRVTSADNPATNGMVHIVEKVLQPVPRDRTLATLIESDPDFSTFRTLLERTGMMDKLREEGPMTVFAPTNKAFDALDEKLRSNLLGGFCDEIVLKHHVLGLTVCSAVVQGRVQAANLNGNFISLEKHGKDDKIFMNDAEVISKDIMGSNGVLYIVDHIDVPSNARPLSTFLDAKNLTQWRDILKRVNLLDEIDNDKNYTMIVPTPKALEQIKELTSSDDEESNKKLRDIVLYHTVKPAVPSCDLKNGRNLKSELDGKNIRISLYSGPYLDTQGTLQCARIVASDGATCGGRIYMVDKIMQPASGSLVDLLSDEKYSQFRNLLEVSEVLPTLSGDGPFTVLAPSNEAFDDVSPNNMKKLLADKELAGQVVKRHIIPALLCCSGVSTFSWPFTSSVRTLSDHSAALRRSQGKVQIGDTVVTECDKLATNGIVHQVDKVMLPIDLPTNRRTVIFNSQQDPNTDIVLYGL